MKKNTNTGLLVLRISVGALMLLHGLGKLNGGLEFISGVLESKGLPGFIAYGVLVGEILAPFAIIIGYRTRIAAAILAINCLVAIFMVHNNTIFSLSESGGWSLELIGMFLFGAIALLFTGGGKYSISNKKIWD